MTTSHVRAQGDPVTDDGEAHESPEYAEAIAAALVEFRAGAYPEARASFQRAHAILPSARTLRGLGVVEFELKHYAASLAYLEEALASDVRPLDERQRKEAQDLIARAKSYVVPLRLELKPPTATVLVDGVEVVVGDVPEIMLRVGDHVIDVRATGHMDTRRKISIEGGRPQSLRVELAPLSTPTTGVTMEPAALANPGIETDHHDGAFYETWWFWTATGVAVAGAAIAAIGVAASGDEQAPATRIEGAPQVMALESR